jgi:hypothetical protein
VHQWRGLLGIGLWFRWWGPRRGPSGGSTPTSLPSLAAPFLTISSFNWRFLSILCRQTLLFNATLICASLQPRCFQN